MLKPDGRVVMVSGAARGIGRATAERLVASGFSVSAGVRDPARLDGGERLSVHRYEAEEAGSAERWVAETVARWGRIDGLVNAAGIHKVAKVFEAGEDDLDEMWRVNVKGPLRVIRAAGPHLEAAGHGRVVNIASSAGKRVPVTLGDRGSLWLRDGVLRHVPARPVAAADTTGCGDVFHGAYALALAEGAGWEEAAGFATAAAALKAVNGRSWDGMPDRAAVAALMKDQPMKELC